VFGLAPSSEPVNGICVANEDISVVDSPTEGEDFAHVNSTEYPETITTQIEEPSIEIYGSDTDVTQQTPSALAGK